VIINFMKNLNGTTNKFIALIVMTVVSVGMVVVFVYDSISGRNIPDIVSSFMYTMVGYMVGFSVHALGVDNGANISKESQTTLNDITTAKLPIVTQDKAE
jgi:hypothetical protein